MRSLASAFLTAASLCYAASSVPTLPSWFEPDGQGRYVSRGPGGRLVLEGSAATLRLPGSANPLRLTLKGANPAAAGEPLDPLPGRTNYFVGNDRSAWRTGVGQFARVRVRSVYPGIDVIYVAQGRELEYDFVIAPGADPAQIRLQFDGAQSLRVARDGALIVDLGTHLVRQAPPSVYQESAPGAPRHMIRGRYALVSANEVRFVLGRYDRTKELVIDPVISFVSYLGGDKFDQINAMTPAPDGGVWIVGFTSSDVTLPGGQPQPFESNDQGFQDAFVAKMQPGATPGTSVLVDYTFLGGSQNDQATAVAVDSQNRVYVTGWTASANFPVTTGAPQTTAGGEDDAFITVLDMTQAANSQLIFSSYYGGAGNDIGTVVAVRPNGRILVSGTTTSGTLPNAGSTTLQQSNRGGIDVFLAEFDVPSNTLIYSTFLGGDGTDIPTGIAVRKDGTVLLTGFTSSDDFPTAGFPYSSSSIGLGDAFITVLDTSQLNFAALIFSGYFGGSDLDYPTAMVQDSDGTIWIAGYTFSHDLPVTANAVLTVNVGDANIFVAHLDLTKYFTGELQYCTYLGGSSSDVPYALVREGASRVTLAGYTTSVDFPLIGTVLTFVPTGPGVSGFIASIDTAVSSLPSIVYSGLIGAPGLNVINSLVRDPQGNLFFGGYSTSSSFPVTDGLPKPNVSVYPSGFVGMIKP